MRSFFSSWSAIATKLGFTQKKKKRKKGNRRSPFTRRLWIEPLEDRRVLSITVNTPLDFTDGSINDGSVSLRDAVLRAPDGETINFAQPLNGQTINLLPSLGEIAFAKSLTIDASMLSGGLTINAGGGLDQTVGNGDGFRIFKITRPGNPFFDPPLAMTTIKGLTLTGGDVSGDAGGAISSTELLTLEECVVRNNYASGNGGGVAFDMQGFTHEAPYVDPVFRLLGSTVTENHSSSDGGGVYVNTSIFSNSAPVTTVEISDSSRDMVNCCGRGIFSGGDFLGFDSVGKLNSFDDIG